MLEPFAVILAGAFGIMIGWLVGRKQPDISLREKNVDLASQVEDLRKSRPYMEGEQSAIAAIRAAHDATKEQQDKIALWLREHKKAEIARGDHKGKGLADVCIMYMSKSTEKENRSDYPI